MSTAHLYQYKPFQYTYEYDYVFTGSGAAALSLIMRMLQSGKFREKTFLLIDQDRKNKNDRTWCFWEKNNGYFEDIVYKKWDHFWFHGEEFSKKYDIRPYQYKMIRGLDFYNHCMEYIKKQENVSLLFEPIDSISDSDKNAIAKLKNGEQYFAREYLFNSIMFDGIPDKPGTQTLLQHFKGWQIEADHDFFDPTTCTLMDFRVNQQYGSTFVYTMPFDTRRALIEFTIFSPALITDAQYEAGLQQYVSDFLKLEKFTILEKEFGIIPMSNYRFPKGSGRIVALGTAGGQTKSSSGYTFQFIQRHSEALLSSLIETGIPTTASLYPERFRFYDNVLLDVLSRGELGGARIFSQLFKRNPAKRILRFLDNSSWVGEELLLIGSLPTGPFLKSAMGRIKK